MRDFGTAKIQPRRIPLLAKNKNVVSHAYYQYFEFEDIKCPEYNKVGRKK